MYQHIVGIEHLSTGVEFETSGGSLTFERHSRSMFMVSSFHPFTVVWPRVGGTLRIQAQWNSSAEISTTPYTDGTIRAFADKANRGVL